MNKSSTQTSKPTHSDKPTLLLVAKIGRVVGFDGALKLHISTDFPHIFKPGASFHLNKKLFLSQQGDKQTSFQNPVQIQNLRIASFHAEKSLVVFEGFASRESAAKLVNYELYSTLEESREMCGLKEGEFLWEEIVGAEVRDVGLDSENALDMASQATQQGETLGRVREIERIGEVDYLCIDTDSELIGQGLPKGFLVPYIPQYVLSLSPEVILTRHAKALLENS